MAYYPPYFNRGNYINPMQTAPQMPMQNVPQMEYPQYQQMPQQTSDMIWVLNESEATAYPVAPNNSVVLWDKNNPVIYVKSVNMQGVPSMRVLDFSERMPDNATKTSVEHKCQCGGKFAPIEDFKRLQEEFEALQEKVETLNTKATTKLKKEEAENDG
jgi:hypothetical protein